MSNPSTCTVTDCILDEQPVADSQHCQYCEALAKFRAAVRGKMYLNHLPEFVFSLASSFMETRLTNIPYVPELTDDGFVLRFSNGMELGLKKYLGTIRYHGKDSLGTYRGQISQFYEANANRIYDHIVDMLLVMPPRPASCDGKSELAT